MTFLQPFILWGLPLVLVPVVIHLINRRRFRTLYWGAMEFLLSAARHSSRHAKLRNFFILLLRVLAVLGLIMLLSRPLSGGWLGWAMAGAPEAIFVLVDRSASMESQVISGGDTRRELGLARLRESLAAYEGHSRLYLLDSASLEVQELAGAESLTDLPAAGPSDTAADIPLLVESALQWLGANGVGTADLWMVSDLQAGNWKPEDPRWKSLFDQIEEMTTAVRFRLLAMDQVDGNNTAVVLRGLEAGTVEGSRRKVRLAVELRSTSTEPRKLPVRVAWGELRKEYEVAMSGRVLRWQTTLELPDGGAPGWGMIELPDDLNGRDNRLFLVHGELPEIGVAVRAEDPLAGRYLRLAAGAHRADTPQEAIRSEEELVSTPLEDTAVVVWQDGLPIAGSAASEVLRDYVSGGGVVVCFPPGHPDAGGFAAVEWRPVQKRPTDSPWQINEWNKQEGVLASSRAGTPLRVGDLICHRRQMIAGDAAVLARFDDGVPFLVRKRWGEGACYFVATLPHPEWSNLADGHVLVPMMQRLVEEGSERLQPAGLLVCGAMEPADQARQWEPVSGAAGDTPKDRAGVYRSGTRLVAVNIPPEESEWETVEPETVDRLLPGLAWKRVDSQADSSQGLQGELWRGFLGLMLAALLVESAVLAPRRQRELSAAPSKPTGPPRERHAA